MLAPAKGWPVDEEAVRRGVARGRRVLAEWERLMGGAPFLAGAEASLADFLVAPLVIYLPGTAEGRTLMAERPVLADWAARMAARPSVAATRGG